jgi:WD40 repeat protein/predicted Ser/Thr protein kinase
MAEEPSDRIEALFHQAADLPPDEQRTLLDAACQDDPALRAAVEKLLADDARLRAGADSGTFLESPVVLSRPQTSTADQSAPVGGPSLPPRIGRYRILRLLGEGGMGAVYEAEQDSPHRTVALKVIRPGPLALALLKRFKQEVEILGRLHHPGIAQIYDAGMAEDGQPFFAMEYIRGQTLGEYARLRAVTVQARVELMARVCDAAQHAHDKGVIHRDLKPANILVDETGQPKVLDFGVARATDADLLTGAGLTQTGQLLGTPNYMSPEQVTGDPAAIDHRADVYALGVILFELLAHGLPYQLTNRPLAEAARLILEQDAPRLGSINPELRGDVETIVAKALEKDRSRRYASAADLAADLRRWLAHEPILARPPSALYHLRKFARRHKALVGGVVATVLALVLGLVGTILFAVGEAQQRRQADYKTREAQFQTYRARIAAAEAALSAHDVADAASQLKEAPQDLRDWEWHHLHSRLDDSSAVVPWPGPEAGLLPGAPDRLRAWALTSGGLLLTDLESGEQKLLPIAAQGRRKVTVAQTRRGLRFVAWVGKTSFDLLDEAGQQLCRVQLPEAKEPYHVVLSPDGTRLAVTAPDWKGGRLAVFDATSGKQMAVCAGHNAPTYALTFSPDGTQLASGSEDMTVRLWDTASGEQLAKYEGHRSRIYSIAFRPDGARFVTASSDETVRQWDTATRKELGAPYERHGGEVVLAVYSPDGEWVASTGIDRTVRVWQATLREDVAILHGHTGPVVGLAFATGGLRLASFSSEATRWGGGDGTVRLWDVDPSATLPVLRGHKRAIYPVALSPDGRWIASGDADGEVRLWDAVTGEPCAKPLPHPHIVQSLAWSHDGTWLVTTNPTGDRLRIWDAATARVRKKIIGPASDASFVTVSPDGRRVAVTTFDSSNKERLRVVEIASGECLFSVGGGALSYSPDGRWLAVRAPNEKTVLLLDARTHEEAARFSGHDDRVWSAAFSPDSRLLASCSRDRTVRVWQVGSGECRELRGHTNEVFTAAFHPDGKRLATGGRDRAVWLWDLERREEVARLRGHTSFVWSLAFSKDGATLVSGSGDATVRLWDTASLKNRYDARHKAEALRPEAERLVEKLFHQKKDAAEVVAAVRADPSLSESQRHAALRAVLRWQSHRRAGRSSSFL